MSFKVITLSKFQKQAKKLSKKYASLDNELDELFDELAENPTIGDALRDNVYKIRLAIAAKNKGKSGGARVITFVKIIDEMALLLSIYNKGEKDTISDAEIDALLEEAEE